MTAPAAFMHFAGSYIIMAYFMFWIYPKILEDRENNDDDK